VSAAGSILDAQSPQLDLTEVTVRQYAVTQTGGQGQGWELSMRAMAAVYWSQPLLANDVSLHGRGEGEEQLELLPPLSGLLYLEQHSDGLVQNYSNSLY